MEEMREMREMADERMFQAKKEGRNRVIASSEPVLAERYRSLR
jgi:PleD family two-component response regulator